MASLWLGVASGLGCLALADRLACRLGTRGWARLFTPLLALTSVHFLRHMASGLETTLFSCLLLGQVLSLPEEPGHRRRLILSGLLGFLIALTRPEGALYVCALGAMRIRRWRSDWPAWLSFLVPLGIYHAWRYNLFGLVFPRSYYVKVIYLSGPLEERIASGLSYLGRVTRSMPEIALLLAAGATHAACYRRRAAVPLIGLVAVNLAFVLLAGGDLPTFTYWRFLLPTFFVSAMLTSTALTGQRRVLGALALGAAQLAWFYPSQEAYREDRPLLLLTHSGQLTEQRGGVTNMERALGRHLRRTLPRDAEIAGRASGKIPYFSRRPFLDLLGLVSPELTPWTRSNERHAADPRAGLSAAEGVLPSGSSWMVFPRALTIVRTVAVRAHWFIDHRRASVRQPGRHPGHCRA